MLWGPPKAQWELASGLSLDLIFRVFILDPKIVLDPQQELMGEVRVMWVEFGAGQGHGSPIQLPRCFLGNLSLLTSLLLPMKIGKGLRKWLLPTPHLQVLRAFSRKHDKESRLPYLKRHPDGVLNHMVSWKSRTKNKQQ